MSWLDSRHTFSFGGHHDPDHMGFRALRVINDDRVRPGAGFSTHGHRDMEIISYVLDGALEHKDSMGNGSVIRPGEVQRMSAGSGVMHSEANPQQEADTRLLQLWILPERNGAPPSYEQKMFEPAASRGKLLLVAARDGRDGTLTVHQDVDLLVGRFAPGERAEYHLRDGRGAWVQVARGTVRVNGTDMNEGDGAAVEGEDTLRLEANGEVEVLVFDLA
jgi:redox-sensitive bicupin YhaK (pirin superfamily)